MQVPRLYFFLPVALGVLVSGAILIRWYSSRSVTSKTETNGTNAKLPSNHVADRNPNGVVAQPAPVETRKWPPTKALRERAEALVQAARIPIDEFLSKYPFAIPKEEYEGLMLGLERAIREAKDPAVLAALVIAVARGGYRPEALAQLRTVLWNIVREDKELRALVRDKELSRFLVDNALDGSTAASGRQLAAYLLSAHVEDFSHRRPENVESSMLCLDPDDLARLATGLRESIGSEDAQMYLPLLSILDSYSGASSVARQVLVDLLAQPPQSPLLRLNLINSLANKEWWILAEPAGFRFLITCLQERNDQRIPTIASLAFLNCPALVGGDAPQAGEALTALYEQYQWAKSPDPSGKVKEQTQRVLETLATTDIEGAARVVREALADPSVPSAGKSRLLNRIIEVVNGQHVGHRYRKTAPALLAAIESLPPEFSTDASLRELARTCTERLATCRKP